MTEQQPILETLSACQLCGSTATTPEQRGPDYFMRLPGTFQFVRCDGCGLIFQNPRPPLEDIGRYYPDSYGSYAKAQSGIKGQQGLMKLVLLRGQGQRCRLVERFAPKHDGPRRVLDIGCASGLFLEAMLRRPGWEAEGVELNEAAAKATAERLGIPVFAGPFEAARFPDAAFDAVTMWDVLEHFHDPIAGLREVRRILRPGGIVFARVPNASSYVRRMCGRYWVGYDLPRHMTLFAPDTLEHALFAAGFSAPVHQFTSASYLSAIHSLRWWLDDGNGSPERAAKIHRVLYHPVARLAARLPVRIADGLGGGSNLEVIARAEP